MSQAHATRKNAADQAPSPTKTANSAATRRRWRDVWRADAWVRPYFSQYRRALALALTLGVLAFAFAAGLMVAAGFAISGAAEMPASVFALTIPLILVRIFGIGKPLLSYLERLVSHDWVLRMTSSLRLRLYRSLEGGAVFERALRRTGDVLGLLAQDTGHVQNLYLRTIFPAVIAWLLWGILIAVLGAFDVWFALGMLVILGANVTLVPLVSVLANGARQAHVKALRNELYGELTDDVLGVADWVFSQRAKDYLERSQPLRRSLRAEEEAMRRFDHGRDLVQQVLFGIGAVVLLLWCGLYFGGVHGGAANWIAAFVLGYFPLIDAFAPLPVAAVEANAHLDAIERLNEMPAPLSSDEGKKSHDKAQNDSDDETQRESSGKSQVAYSADRLSVPELRIEHVSFAYPGAPCPVLRDLSLRVRPGEKLAILGRSGSGKSTLASLIRGDLVPDEGRVLLGGAPTCEMGDGVARLIGVIQQRTYLFNTTLLDNLRIGNPLASEAQAWKALDRVGLRAMAEALPQGLATVVDEAGLRFSGGERHRIALARVLLQDTPIVLLDEPTVGLDPLTENELLRTLFDALDGRTVVMVTHHLQGVSLMDRVVFIEDGTLELDGTPAELAATSERYQRLLAFDRGV
ncbi:MAG: thiol reductant ABC exporter subunit CydC [Coriobacteriia bacterium]|nr:thiol reductant ABC exporter subunit CydC [Coriobacteriia bacterium]MBS5477290.1 thiol reductant ABC exporter subunit CydC [Coriobacteriia bacterium]